MSDPAASPELLATVRVGPEDARDCVLWLHGLGASGHDFEPIVPALGLPEVRFVFPHAPSRPVTINMGFVMPAWYDILSMDHHDASRESLSDIRESQAQIEALIADERARGAQRIVLAGFSQGAAMSLFAGLRHEGELEGIMVLSGYEVASTLRAERKDSHRTTPFFFGHGRHDPMVPMTRGKSAYEALEGYSEGFGDDAKIRWRDYAMEHQVCPEQVQDIRGWLHAILRG